MKKRLVLVLLSVVTGVIYACPNINKHSLMESKGQHKEVIVSYSENMAGWAKKIESKIHKLNSKIAVTLEKVSGNNICGLLRKG